MRVGEILTSQRRDELLQREERALARNRALRLLATRERSCREVADRLRRHGHDDAIVEATVEWLRERGFLDDLRFARAFSAEKRQAGWGPRRIAADLTRKGVERSVLEQALAPDEDGEGDADRIQEDLVRLVQRRFGRELAADPRRGRQRAAGFLQRRGHDWEAVERILALAGQSDDLSSDTEALFTGDGLP